MTLDIEAIRARHEQRLAEHDPWESLYPFCREAEADIDALLAGIEALLIERDEWVAALTANATALSDILSRSIAQKGR